MTSGVSLAILTGLGGMLAWGCADFFAKKSLEKVNEFTLTFWVQLVGLVPVLLVALTHGWPTVGWPTLGALILFGWAEGVSDVLFYRGYAKGKVSILSPIFASYAGVALAISVVVFGEVLSGRVLAGLLIMLLGILVINVDWRDLRAFVRRPSAATGGVPEIVAATLIYACWLVLFDRVVSGEEWAWYLVIARGAEAAGLFAYARVRHHPLRIGRTERIRHAVGLVGACDIAAYACVIFGFSQTSHTSVVTVLSATFSLPTIVLAHYYLHERITRSQAVAVAAILIGIGVVVA